MIYISLNLIVLGHLSTLVIVFEVHRKVAINHSVNRLIDVNISRHNGDQRNSIGGNKESHRALTPTRRGVS
jgi:hypothetical protein